MNDRLAFALRDQFGPSWREKLPPISQKMVNLQSLSIPSLNARSSVDEKTVGSEETEMSDTPDIGTNVTVKATTVDVGRIHWGIVYSSKSEGSHVTMSSPATQSAKLGNYIENVTSTTGFNCKSVNDDMQKSHQQERLDESETKIKCDGKSNTMKENFIKLKDDGNMFVSKVSLFHNRFVQYEISK